jgi:cytochrome oxidase Cu insertion factor (SCO1/SenC/PrrC family)
MSDLPARPGIQPIVWVIVFGVASALIGLAYFALKDARPAPPSAPMEKFAAVPAFEFTDQTGAPFGSENLKGKIWVANFIFTRCKGPCPLISTRMADLNTKLNKLRDGIVLVSFTVDPDYDTPEVLSKYGELLGANASHWKFLTGPTDAIKDFVVKGLLQPLSTEPDGTPAHSQRFVIVDGDGWIRGFQNGEDPEVVQKLMVDIGGLLREITPSEK